MNRLKTLKTLSFCILSLLLISMHSNAADRYWVGTNTNKNWNTTTNWSTTSGGASGASVPGTADDVYFTSSNLGELILDVNINVRKFTINSGYTNSISQNGKTIVVGAVGAGGMILNDGTFMGNTGNITVYGIFTLAGTNFTSTANTLLINGNYTKSSGTFSHNNGTVTFLGTITITGSTNFYDLNLWSSNTGTSVTFDANSIFNATHNFYNSGGSLARVTSGTLNVQGDIIQQNVYASGGGAGIININGTGNQLWTGQPSTAYLGYLCNVTINKASGTLFLKDVVTLAGTWDHVNGIVDDTTYNATISFPNGSSHMMKGTQTINKLYVGNYGALSDFTVYAGDILTIRKSLTTGQKLVYFAGNIKLWGDYSTEGNSLFGSPTGTGVIEFCGVGDQILSGTDLKGAGLMSNVLINKNSGTLILKKIISVQGNWIWQSGAIDASTYSSTVLFTKSFGTRTISGNHSLYNVDFYGDYANFSNIPVADVVTVTGTLTFESTANYGILINGGTVKALGDISISGGNLNGSTGNLLIAGTGDQLFTGSTTKSNGVLGNVIIDKPSGTLILKNYINSWGNWTYAHGNIDGQTYESSPNPTAVVFNYTSATGKTITGSHSLYHVCFTASYAATIINIAPTTTLTVNGDLTWEGAYALTINGGNIDANKNVTVTNTGVSNGGTATLNFKNGTAQMLTGNNLIAYGALCHIKIDKSAGVLTVKNKISFGGNWTHVNGTLDLTTNTPTIIFYGGGTITAKQDFYNLSFCTGTYEIPLASPVTVTNLLKMENTSTININTGTINVTGNITTINEMTGAGGGNGLININGTGDQLFTGNNLVGAGNLCNVTINKPSGTLTLANSISINTTSTWRYIQGAVDPGLSTVSCLNGSTVNTGTTSSFMQFYNFGVPNGPNTLFCNLIGPLYVRNNLTVGQARTLTTNNYDVTVGGNFSSVGILNGGTSTFTFNGSGRQVVTTGYNLYKVKVDKPSGKIYLDYYNLNVINTLSLIKGVIVSTTGTSLVKLNDNTVVTGASNQSFIAGPVTKIGDDAFTFPLGDTTLTDTARYHPFSITAPAAATASYTAQYYAHNQLTDHSTFTSYASTLKPVSTCEYWSLTRNTGTSVVTPTVGWNANTCNLNALADARVGSWSGTQWTDLGQNSTTGNQTAGTVQAASAGPNATNQYYVLAERMPTPIANQRYWIGNGSNKSWNNTANWAAVSGGPGGNPVPTSNDTVIFDGGGKGEADFDVNVSIAKLLVKSTYNTNALVQGSYTLTVGTGGMSLNGGTFTGGSGAITNNGSFTLGGTSFTSTSATFTIYGSYTKTAGNFIHNNGRVLLKIGTTISGSTNFYSLELSPTVDAVYTLVSSDVLNVLGEFKLSGAPLININSGTIHAQGDVTLANTNVDILGSYTLIIDGTGNQTINGAGAKWQCALNDVVITKTSGTVILKDYISVRGNWTNTNGTTTDVSNSSTVAFNGGSKTISGNTTFKNLDLNSDAITDGIYTIPTSSTLTTEGELKFEGSRPLYLNGKINAKGNITTFHGSGSLVDGGTGTITICGTGDQLFSGYDAPKDSRLCNIVIDKVSGTLTLDKYLTPGHDWTYVKGTVNPGTSTVYFTNGGGNKMVSGKNNFNDVVFYGDLYQKDTVTVVDTMSVNGELKYALKGMTINGGTIAAKGNITITSNDDVIPGSYTLLITGTNNQLLTGTASMQARAALNNVIINKSGGLLTLKDKISVMGNWIYQQGALDAKTNLSTLILRDGNRIFSGNHKLYNLTLLGYDYNVPSTSEIPAGDSITVEGEFRLDGGYPAYLNTGTINATGSIRSTSYATATTGGTATLNICGTTDQSMSGVFNGAGRFCNIKVNKTSGTLNLSGNLTVGASNWIYVKGTVNPGTSRVVFWGDGIVNTVNGASSMEFYSFEVQNGSVTMQSPIIARKDFMTWGSTTLTTNSHDIFVGGYFQNGGVFNLGTTTITFNGTGRQDEYTSTNTSYYKVVINKPSGKVFIDNSFVINTNLTLIKGALVPKSTSPGHYVKILDNATVTGGSNASYIMCGVMKVGDDAFTFPLGDTTLTDSAAYHPLGIPAPAMATSSFLAQYIAKNPLADNPTFVGVETPLKSVSSCEYWLIRRMAGSELIAPTLSWNTNSCNISSFADIRVANWNGANWVDLGRGEITGTLSRGSIKASDQGFNNTYQYYTIGNTSDDIGIKLSSIYCDQLILSSAQLLASDNNLNHAFYRFEFSDNSNFIDYDANNAAMYAELARGESKNFTIAVGLQEGNSYYARVRVKENVGDPWSDVGSICRITIKDVTIKPISSFYTTGVSTLAPKIEWSKTFGGNNFEDARSIITTRDGGCMFLGNTYSSASGDVTNANRGLLDYWVVKLDGTGNLLWSKNIGSGGFDAPYGMNEDSDGGCLLIGQAGSGTGDFSSLTGSGTSDMVAVKLDENGNIGWMKLIGGNGGDLATSIKRLSTGYLVTGYSQSATGDIHGANNGDADGVIIKLDNERNIQWLKVVGTSGYDFVSEGVELPTGDIVVAGAKTTGTNGEDYLIMKLSSSGNVIWEKTYGGTGEDDANKIDIVNGGFVVSGYSYSTDGDVSGAVIGLNIWTIKVDDNGNLVWQKAFGGSGEEKCNGQVITPDGGSISGGYTSSNDHGITTIVTDQGDRDNLLVKFKSTGEVEWFKTFGDGMHERIYDMASTSDGGFITASLYSTKNGSDIALGRGTGDALITKLSEPTYANCVGSNITFTNTSLNASSYEWKVNNVSSGTSTNFSYTFPTAGTYTVTLIASTGSLSNSKSSVINIGVVANAGNTVQVEAGNGVNLGGNPTASNGQEPYTYSWNPSAGLNATTVSNPVANPLISTTYTVTVSDASGCTGTSTVGVNVGVNYPLTDAGIDQHICAGSSTMLAGTGADHYSWFPDAGLSNVSIASPIANPDVTTMYYLRGTSGDSTLIDSVKIIVDPSPSLTVPDEVIKICAGDSKTIHTEGSGSFDWNPSDGLSSTTSSSPIANPLYNTTYQVTLTDANGCKTTLPVVVEVPVININMAHNVEALKDKKIVLQVNTDGDKVEWIPGAGLDDSTSTHPTALLDTTKVYRVRVTKGDCVKEDTVVVVVIDEPTATFRYTAPGLTVQFTADYQGQANYLWDFGDGNTSTAANPQHVYAQEGGYSVCLRITTVFGQKKYCAYSPIQESCQAHQLPDISIGQ